MTESKSPSRQDLHLKEVRELAQKFGPEELERCIQEQLSSGTNPCEPDGSQEEIMNILAKAEYVKERMDGGLSLREAMRELGEKIRAVQQGYNQE